MKAYELLSLRENEDVKLIFDPRPDHFRNCPDTVDRFRNACLNYSHKVRYREKYNLMSLSFCENIT